MLRRNLAHSRHASASSSALFSTISRTNRVLNEKKRFGKIVCFRDLKSNVDAAIKLFSNSNNPEEIVRPPFEEIKQEYKELASDFLKKYPDTNCIDLLQSETAKKEFVLAFRDIIRKHAEIQIYEDYSEEADDLGMTEQQFMDFRSKYLDIHLFSYILINKYAQYKRFLWKHNFKNQRSSRDVTPERRDRAVIEAVFIRALHR